MARDEVHRNLLRVKRLYLLTMKLYHLSAMTKGWFVGDLTPTVLSSKLFEVAVKEYRKGDSELAHYHLVATEITVVVKGRVRMFGSVFVQGDIIVVEKGDKTAFEALEDSSTVVVKTPSVPGDKYFCD